MKLIHIIAALVILTCSARAQDQHVIDSLKSVIEEAKHDTSTAAAYVELSEILYISNLDTVIPLCTKAVEIAERNLESSPPPAIKKKFLISLAAALNNIGYIHQQKGDILLAIEYYHKSIRLEEGFGNKRGTASTYNNIGRIYKQQGDIPLALEYYHKSLKIKEEINDKKGMANSYNNIGFIHSHQGDVTLALDYYHKCLTIREEIGDKRGIAESYNNIGFIYKSQGDVPLAIEYIHKSLKIREEIGDKDGLAFSLHNVGSIYNDQGDIEKALDYYHRSLKLREELIDKRGIAESLISIGNLEMRVGELTSVKIKFERALELGKEIGSPASVSISSYHLCKLAKQQGNYKEALETYELHIQMRDSIKNEETQKATIRQQTKYEFEKAQLVKEQEENEAARIVAEETSRRDNLQYSVILIGILTLFGGVLALGFINVSERMAEGLIFFSFLILFEFLLVLADPSIESWSGGAPGIKLLFNAGIAALIFPAHAFFESRLKQRLVKTK